MFYKTIQIHLKCVLKHSKFLLKKSQNHTNSGNGCQSYTNVLKLSQNLSNVLIFDKMNLYCFEFKMCFKTLQILEMAVKAIQMFFKKITQNLTNDFYSCKMNLYCFEFTNRIKFIILKKNFRFFSRFCIRNSNQPQPQLNN